LNYMNILQNLKQVKGIGIHYVVDFVRSMMGFLFNVKYKESNKTDFLNYPDLSIFELVALMQVRNPFCLILYTLHWIRNPSYFWQSPQHNECLFLEEIENIMKTILLMFYNSVKLKFFPGKYDITQHNTIWICRNFTIICFHGISIDFWISHFDASKKSALFDSLYFT
jgi:hypothetical protein